MKTQKTLWYEVAESTTIETIDKVCQLTYEALLVDVRNIELFKNINIPQRMGVSFYIKALEDIDIIKKHEKLAKNLEYIITNDISLWKQLKGKTKEKSGLIVEVNSKEELDRVVGLVEENPDVVIITFKDTTNIPLELILAVSQKYKVRIIKKVKDSRDGQVSLMTMEVGADGLLFSSNNIEEIVKMSNIYQQSNNKKFELKEAIVTKIKPSGMGSRVCIDTTSELKQSEGMILGSTSSGGLLTCSETHFLPYMNLRTFRVNAGGIHLYVWGPNEQALYLSDLKAGDSVYVVDHLGNARAVTVGRVKIESRPLLLIECEIEGVKINTFIQDDWHVRMFGSKGEIYPSSEIKVGDKLLGYLDEPGRHVGLKISESIIEK